MMKWSGEQVLTGVGMIFATSVLLPLVKNLAGSSLANTRTGVSLAGHEVRKRFTYVQEELEDFVAEVQFERLKRKIDKEMGSDE